jgi:antirestriction protein ArdC
VTARILADLEQGVRPWVKPWHADPTAGSINRPLRANGTPYQGVNVLLLWGEAVEKGYAAPFWMTFKQAAGIGAQVRKGEHGALVVYADRITRSETDTTGEAVEKEICFMKAYTVFNVEQIDGLPAHYFAASLPRPEARQRIAAAEAFFAGTGADIRTGGNHAFYSPTGDFIQLPPFEAFRDAESHAATLAHELTHWTRHPSRLDRDFGRQRYGDAGYAREELVAEMGAAFLCADLGLTPETREDHAAYIASWLEVLNHDPRFIFTAASAAQRAVDFLHGLQPRTETAAEALAA